MLQVTQQRTRAPGELPVAMFYAASKQARNFRLDCWSYFPSPAISPWINCFFPVDMCFRGRRSVLLQKVRCKRESGMQKLDDAVVRRAGDKHRTLGCGVDPFR